MNASGLVRASVLAVIGICTLPVPAQQRDGERKVRIEVTRTENGQRTRETREFDLSDEKQLADALRELGVMDELNIIGDDENLVLDLKRTREGGMLNDMCVALSLADEAIAQQQPAYLGVYYNDWNGDKGKNAPPIKKGAVITSVEDGTAAEKSGLKAGDVIVGMDDRRIDNGEDLAAAINAHKPGDEVKVTFYRGREKQSRAVKLGVRCKEPMEEWSYAFPEMVEPVPQNWAQAMELNEEGAFLGVEGDDVEDGKGVRITNVTDSSAAATMGIKEGDVMLTINGQAIDDFDDLVEFMDGKEPEESVQVRVQREGKEMMLNGKLGRKPRQVWSWSGDEWNFDMPDIPPMPPMAPMAPMPPMPDPMGAMNPEEREEYEQDMAEYRQDMAVQAREMAEYARDRAEQRREMDELRREMDRLRRELRSEPVHEMRITVEAVRLSDAEIGLLEGKGVKGLDTPLDLPGLNVFPNPADASFTITFEAAERGDLSVDMHDAKGERVYHESITGFKGNYQRVIDWSDRTDGTYFVVIAQNGKAVSRKVIKQ